MTHEPYCRAMPTNWRGGDEPTRAECSCGWHAEAMPSLTVARQAFDTHVTELAALPCGGCGVCLNCAVRGLRQ